MAILLLSGTKEQWILKLVSESLRKQDIYILSKYLCTKYFINFKGKTLTGQESGRYHRNWRIKVTITSIRTVTSCASHSNNTECSINSVVFLPRMHNLNLITRKHQSNLNWVTFSKLARTFQKIWKSQKERLGDFQIVGDQRPITTKCNTWSWIDS